MKTLKIEVDDEVVERLDRLEFEAPARKPELIASAIRKALWELEEQQVARAYRSQPDSEDAYVDPEVWER
jgi:predicted transcriptional regulator